MSPSTASSWEDEFQETLSHFDAVVLSFEVGVRRPDPRIYEHCLHLAGRPRSLPTR